jgi:hypothetical protein
MTYLPMTNPNTGTGEVMKLGWGLYAINPNLVSVVLAAPDPVLKPEPESTATSTPTAEQDKMLRHATNCYGARNWSLEEFERNKTEHGIPHLLSLVECDSLETVRCKRCDEKAEIKVRQEEFRELAEMK